MTGRLITAVAIIAMSVTSAAQAGEQFVDEAGIANFGYDVVAYHTEFVARKGDAAYAVDYNGAPFWFASAENRDRFAADPAAYAPAYDGHCAFALTRHKKLTVDPEAFSIVNSETGALVDREVYEPGTGVLYLNYSPSVNGEFNDDIPGAVEKADFAWNGCLETRPAAEPKKRLRDLFAGKRPEDCPAAN